MNKKIFSIVSVCAGIVMILGVLKVAPACHAMADGKFMKCHWMEQTEVMFSILLCALGLMNFFLSEETLKLAALIGCVISVLMILSSTTFIGTCANIEMACNAHTKPTVLIIAGIYCLYCIIVSISVFRKRT